MKQFLQLLFPLFLVFGFFVPQAHAFTFVSNEDGVASFQGATNGSGFIAGSTVRVEHEVSGDLFCAGRDVFIKTTIDGDVICAGQYVTLEGHVTGNVRVAGQHVTILGTVDKNVTAFAQKLTVSDTASIGGELITGVQDLTVSGVVNKDMLIGSNTTFIEGKVGGDAKIYAESLAVDDEASISGGLSYAAGESDIAQGVVAGGVVQEVYKKPAGQKKTETIAPKQDWIHNRLPSILIHLGLGLFLVLLIPGRMKKVTVALREQPLRTFAVGIISFVLLPVFLLLCVITIIGIPVAFLAGMLFAFIVMISRLFVALFVGEQVLGALYEKKKDHLLWQASAGIVITWLAFSVPVVGGLLSLIALLWGTGGILYSMYAGIRNRK